MKKILTLLMCVALLFSFATVADAATNYCVLFEDKIGTLRWAIELGDGKDSVAEGQSFGAYTIISYCESELSQEYFDTNSEYYYIPADVFEAKAKASFSVCDINALRSAQFDSWITDSTDPVKRNHYREDKNAYEFPTAGGLGDSTIYVVQGYTANGSKYTVYSYFVEQDSGNLPAGAVEGKDYIIVDDNKCEILHILKNVVETDGTNVKFHSWQQVSDIPSGIITPSTKVEDNVVSSSTPSSSTPATNNTSSNTTSSNTTSSKPTQTTSSEAATSSNVTVSDGTQEKPLVTLAQIATAKLETEGDIFPLGTEVKVEEISIPATLEPIKESLKDISDKFVAYEITAISNNVAVQPNGKVKATFNIPVGYDLSRIAVFFVAKDGSTEKLASSVDKVNKTVSAELSHFSTYVVVETNVDIKTDVEDTDNNETEDTKKDNGALIWIIIAIAVVAIGGGVAAYFFVFKKRFAKTKEEVVDDEIIL